MSILSEPKFGGRRTETAQCRYTVHTKASIMEDANDPSTITTRLLTLLNVSATKSLKRRRLYDELTTPVKLNKRKSVRISEDIISEPPSQPESVKEAVAGSKSGKEKVKAEI